MTVLVDALIEESCELWLTHCFHFERFMAPWHLAEHGWCLEELLNQLLVRLLLQALQRSLAEHELFQPPFEVNLVDQLSKQHALTPNQVVEPALTEFQLD